MRHYEATIVLSPALGEEGIKQHIEKTKGLIEARGGTILVEHHWGVRTLAYLIQKQSQGFYLILEFEGSNEVLTDLDKALRLDEYVLRHLVIHLDPKALAEREQLRLRREKARAEAALRAAEDEDDDSDDNIDDDDEDEEEER